MVKNDKLIRLNKAVALTGVASRRKAESLILDGNVHVNGKVVTELSTLINPQSDKLMVNGKTLSAYVKYTYILLNKPRGYVSTCSDPNGKKTVLDLIIGEKHRIFPVGRLDIQTEGALLLTNDGDFSNSVMNPKRSIPKMYKVKVDGIITDSEIESMRKGMVINRRYKTKPARVHYLSTTGKNSWIKIVITEGKNRQIRKMCDKVGHSVLKLKRTAIGPFKLEELRSGEYKILSQEEIDYWKKVALN